MHQKPANPPMDFAHVRHVQGGNLPRGPNSKSHFAKSQWIVLDKMVHWSLVDVACEDKRNPRGTIGCMGIIAKRDTRALQAKELLGGERTIGGTRQCHKTRGELNKCSYVLYASQFHMLMVPHIIPKLIQSHTNTSHERSRAFGVLNGPQ